MSIAIMAQSRWRSGFIRTALINALSSEQAATPFSLLVYQFPLCSSPEWLPCLYAPSRHIALTILDDAQCANPLLIIDRVRHLGSKRVIVICGRRPAPSIYASLYGPDWVAYDTLPEIAVCLPGMVARLHGFPLTDLLSRRSIERESGRRLPPLRGSTVRKHFFLYGYPVTISGGCSQALLTRLLTARDTSTPHISTPELRHIRGISRFGLHSAIARLRETLASQTNGQGRKWITYDRERGYALTRDGVA